MLRRLPTAVALACIVTFGLFWSMQALVNIGGEQKEGSSGATIEFVRLKRDRTPEVKKREPPRREKPKQQPAPPEMNMAKNINPKHTLSLALLWPLREMPHLLKFTARIMIRQMEPAYEIIYTCRIWRGHIFWH